MKIFIGCSSRKTNFDAFQIEASELATHLANAGYDLVIGGLVDGGMMGRVYQAFLDAKRGITVHTLKEYQEEVNDKKYTKVEYHRTTFERTLHLYRDADTVLFLPGGTGSISELFAMLDEHRTIENTKEIILYNQNGYYAWVLELLAKLVQMGFNDTSIFSHIKVFNEQSDVLRYLKEKIKKEG